MKFTICFYQHPIYNSNKVYDIKCTYGRDNDKTINVIEFQKLYKLVTFNDDEKNN